MEPISTYSEVTLTGKVKYELYSDKIVLSGKGAASYDFEQSLALTKISSDFIKIRVRPIVSWIGLLIFLVAGLLSVVLVTEFAIQSSAIPGVLGISSVAGLIVAIATMKKVEYARFCSEGYGMLVLNLARSGPDRNQFDVLYRLWYLRSSPRKRRPSKSSHRSLKLGLIRTIGSVG